MNTIEPILEKIGLTKQESKVYLSLLELQEAQTGKLCRFTKIASSNIYNILDSLIQKGLVSYRIQNNIKVFMPAPPEALNELFLEKQRKLDEERKQVTKLISTLKKREIKQQPQSNYKYYEGIVGIKSMWHEINTSMSKEDIIKCYTCQEKGYNRLVGFYDEHHKLRVRKKVKSRLILPFDEEKIAKKRRKQLAEIKFMDLKNDSEWGVFGDTIYIQYITSKKPRSFLIKDKIFAKTFEQVFNQLWKQAKK
tara:strand:+ start:1024 stop:1776 length:753 start_codon:yes stop_codon:yes gene_type:complete